MCSDTKIGCQGPDNWLSSFVNESHSAQQKVLYAGIYKGSKNTLDCFSFGLLHIWNNKYCSSQET